MNQSAESHPNIRIGYCPTPPEGVIEIRRNVRTAELVRLAESGTTQSRDEPLSADETTEENVNRLYTLAGVAPPVAFTSLSLMIERTASGKTALGCYGANVLIIRPETLADVVLVNGDLKTVGRFLQDDGRDEDVVVRCGGAIKYEELARLANNNRPGAIGPRLRGSYFEGRLLRALRAEDVESIYIRYSDDQEALNAAAAILAASATP